MDLGLKDRVALVCAASQGLGKAAAVSLAREGARVVVCSRDAERVEAAAKEIARSVGIAGAAQEPMAVVADVSRADDIRELVATVVERFGRLDICVSNAGGPPVADFADLEDAQWEAGVQLTLLSTVRLARAVIPHMRRNGWGRFVTITSVAARQPIDDLVISSTLRPGLLGLTRVLANRYGREGILVNAVAPGFILTARQEEILRSRAKEKRITREEYLQQSARQVPLGRLGNPEELGDAIAFLASERASYINGVLLTVDGGLLRGLP